MSVQELLGRTFLSSSEFSELSHVHVNRGWSVMVSLFPDTLKGERNEEGPKAVGPPAVCSEARYHTLLKAGHRGFGTSLVLCAAALNSTRRTRCG